jgi:hypothetical protein
MEHIVNITLLVFGSALLFAIKSLLTMPKALKEADHATIYEQSKLKEEDLAWLEQCLVAPVKVEDGLATAQIQNFYGLFLIAVGKHTLEVRRYNERERRLVQVNNRNGGDFANHAAQIIKKYYI